MYKMLEMRCKTNKFYYLCTRVKARRSLFTRCMLRQPFDPYELEWMEPRTQNDIYLKIIT